MRIPLDTNGYMYYIICMYVYRFCSESGSPIFLPNSAFLKIFTIIYYNLEYSNLAPKLSNSIDIIHSVKLRN